LIHAKVVADGEGPAIFGIDLPGLDRAAYYAGLPGTALGVVPKFRDHSPGERLERLADRLA
jgi:hypothetical protein